MKSKVKVITVYVVLSIYNLYPFSLSANGWPALFSAHLKHANSENDLEAREEKERSETIVLVSQTMQKHFPPITPNESLNENASDFAGGSFDLVLRKDLNAWDKLTDRRLGVTLDAELTSLFYRVLNCPKAEAYLPDDNIESWLERRRLSFQRAIPEYPMLGRLWDPFRNVWYAPEEVAMLQSECMSIRSSTDDALAIRGLSKLIAACDEAIRTGVGLFLVSD